jgi:putative methylase
LQRRLVRKLDLEMLLSQVEPHPTPRADLEQYTIPADVAATILYMAAYGNGDIVSKSVLDLGCGTGRLALGAAFLGARDVVGVDIDKSAIRVAAADSVRVSLRGKVQWVAGDIDAVRGKFDTVLQNPPFGVQRKKADRQFVEKALMMGRIIYSLHKHPRSDKKLLDGLRVSKDSLVPTSASPFLKKFIESRGGRIRSVYAMLMSIPFMFRFHTKRKHEFAVDLYIIESNSETCSLQIE